MELSQNKRYLIISAGGRGVRMKSDLPKQFLPLAGKPLLMHTLNAFAGLSFPLHIILVLPNEQILLWETLCHEHNFKICHQVVQGGETRFHSVKNGLDAIDGEEGVTGVHDGVRPLVSAARIETVFSIAELRGNAIPSIPIPDSLRKIDGNTNTPVDRNKYQIIQTPQCFKTAIIKTSFKQAYKTAFTDEASVVESAGHSINLVEGDPENIKITNPHDLIFAEFYINNNFRTTDLKGFQDAAIL